MATDHTLVHGIPHLLQFEQNKSQYRCEAACLSALSAFARPNHWPNLSLLMSEIYTKYVQGPYAGQDVTANQYGLTKSDALDWLHSNGIGYYDLQSIVDTGDMDLLKHHMGAMNECGIPVMLGINDESHIYQAKLQADGSYVQGTKTHSWADTGLKHCIIRVGMRLDAPVTLINDPATAYTSFRVSYPHFVGELEGVWYQHGNWHNAAFVSAPDASFQFYNNGVKNVWPVPAVKLDAVQLIDDLDLANNMLGSVDGALSDVLNTSLGNIPAVIDLCKRTIAQVRASHSKIADDIHNTK